MLTPRFNVDRPEVARTCQVEVTPPMLSPVLDKATSSRAAIRPRCQVEGTQFLTSPVLDRAPPGWAVAGGVEAGHQVEATRLRRLPVPDGATSSRAVVSPRRQVELLR